MLNNFKKKILNSNSGQSLLEVVIVISVGLIIVSALVFATISGLRNAQFAKNQSVATKYAQEGLEALKAIRDRDRQGTVELTYTGAGGTPVTTSKFSDLWNVNLASACNFSATAVDPCYMLLSSLNGVPNSKIKQDVVSATESLEDGNFRRQVQIKDGNDPAKEKIVTVVVKWTDFSGEHQSELTTILRKL